MSTIDSYADCKLDNKSVQAQEATDHAIVNFLEYALGSKILVDDVPDNNSQVANYDISTQDLSLSHIPLPRAFHRSSSDTSDDDESGSGTILDDFSDYASQVDSADHTHHQQTLNVSDDNQSSSNDTNMNFNKTSVDQKMSGLDQESQEWER